MKYVCCECGYEFDEPRIERDYRGEFWGVPAYEDVCVCPNCKTDYIEEKEEIDNDRMEIF